MELLQFSFLCGGQSQSMTTASSSSSSLPSDSDLGIGERALSAAGAAVISAIIVNPLDVAKVSASLQFHFFLKKWLQEPGVKFSHLTLI